MAPPSSPEPSWEYQLRKYLMLLATLVAMATYTAGLAPPGGFWPETVTERRDGGHTAGDPILYNTSRSRYLAFFYFNATAFAASLVVNLLLLVLSETAGSGLPVLRSVMVLDLFSFMGAYATGSCRDAATTAFASALVAALAAYVGVHIWLAYTREEEDDGSQSSLGKEQRKVLMLLATFAAEVSFAAGLNPPGGFRDTAAGAGPGHSAGDATLKADQPRRLMAFFYCNTTAFVSSLFIIALMLSRRLQRAFLFTKQVQYAATYGFVLLALLGLLGAYAAGSCREADTTAYVVALVAAVLAYIFLAMAAMVHYSIYRDRHKNDTGCLSRLSWIVRTSDAERDTDLGKIQSLVLLLATLAASITYQAGLTPPGGVWPEDGGGGHKAGDPILMSTDGGRRYKVFFYCNSTSFVASLVVILMVQCRTLVRPHTLEAAMILDLFGLIGAYAAGSSRDVGTSIYVLALAGAVLVYVVIHVVFFTLDQAPMAGGGDRGDGEKRLHKRRKRLLLLAILVVTITYQAGLTPPGGFWLKSDGDVRLRHTPGASVLRDTYPARYQAFFYCNAASFMASAALIVLLVNPNLYLPAMRCHALDVCMVVALLGLMGAYAAGSARLVKTSIYVFVLVGAVVAFILVQLRAVFLGDGDPSIPATPAAGDAHTRADPDESSRSSSRRKYLMTLAILAASVTYQAGLDPPGSVWQDGGGAGNPVMRDVNRRRYHAFLYSNSVSFVASVVVIVLLLQESLHPGDDEQQGSKLVNGYLLYAMNTAIVLDMLGLLGAYAAGSSREWATSGYVVALVAAVLLYVAAHLVVWLLSRGGVNPDQNEEEEDGQREE